MATDFEKLSIGEIRNFSSDQLKETENEIRREIAMINMDVYSNRSQYTGKLRGLRRNLARVLTVGNEAKSAKTN